jgi:hypothetical protein
MYRGTLGDNSENYLSSSQSGRDVATARTRSSSGLGKEHALDPTHPYTSRRLTSFPVHIYYTYSQPGPSHQLEPNNTTTTTTTTTPTTRRKKRTKTSIACEACQTRKSRCELVTQRGCHRCAVLGTVCSLVGSGRASTSAPTSGSISIPASGYMYDLSADNDNDNNDDRLRHRRDTSRIPGQHALGSRESSMIGEVNGGTSFNPHYNLKRSRSSAEKEAEEQEQGEDLQEIKRRTIDIQNMLRTILSSQPQFQSPSTMILASTSKSALPSAATLPPSIPVPDRYHSTTTSRPTSTHQNQSYGHNHHYHHNQNSEESELYGKTHPEGGPIGSSLLALGLACPPVYLDPIELGVVLPREMERVYQV